MGKSRSKQQPVKCTTDTMGEFAKTKIIDVKLNKNERVILPSTFFPNVAAVEKDECLVLHVHRPLRQSVNLLLLMNASRNPDNNVTQVNNMTMVRVICLIYTQAGGVCACVCGGRRGWG